MHPPVPVVAFLGASSAPSVSDGECMVPFVASLPMTNPSGVVQSGVLAAMAECAFGPLVGSVLGAGGSQRTVELGVRPLTTVRPGSTVLVRAAVAERHPGWLRAHAQLYDEAGTVVARAWVHKLIEPTDR